ncbi:MAG: aminopeptidase P family protein [Sedimentisphaerales bacterium]|nr:aminopeptidase P family protein [Sedimentisphaerales bacterium]
MATVSLKTCVNARMNRFRRLLDENHLEGFIVTNVKDVQYLTGFSGEDSILLILGRRATLITDSRFVLLTRRECPRLRVHIHRRGVIEAVGELAQQYRKRSSRRKPISIGIDPDTVTHRGYGLYRKAAGKGFTLKAVGGLARNLRRTKDAYETAQIRKAICVAEESLLATLKHVKPGVTEMELRARLEYEMSRWGSSEPAFATIIAFGGHAAEPHAQPGSARLRKGQCVLFDWGATVNGYRSDLTRTYATGKISRDFAQAYQRVLNAQLAAIEAVKPGVALAEIDAAARRAMGKPQGEYRHGTGHGIGLDIHELPAFHGRAKGELQPGMIVTIEPAIYLAGKLGIRIEDDVLVTQRGGKVLSTLAKDLDTMLLPSR